MNQNQVVTNNIVMNNYISFNNPSNPEHNTHKPLNSQKQVPIDDIMDFFSTRYKSILPNRVDTDFELQGILFPFQKAEIAQLLQQMDILIQLLAQNFLFAATEETKFKSYELLMKINNKKNFATSFLEHMPTYSINFAKFKVDPISQRQADPTKPGGSYQPKCNISINFKPQMSILQSPTLELTPIFIEMKSKLHSKEKLKEALLYLEPLIQKNWVPIFMSPNMNQASMRTKFNPIDDCLLLHGLNKFGAKKNLELIQKNFLPEKSAEEIKNRYKNLICSRASDNKIRRWKALQFAPLREDELVKLQTATEWFGNSPEKAQLIARYFLVDRSPEFIKASLTSSDALTRKRKKYANLLNSVILNDPSPSVALDINAELNLGDAPPHALPLEQMREMDIEKEDKAPELCQEPFERALITYERGENEAMPLENEKRDENTNRFMDNSSENFEAEELNSSSAESSSSEERNIFDDRIFKKIGSEIFEYEEI